MIIEMLKYEDEKKLSEECRKKLFDLPGRTSYNAKYTDDEQMEALMRRQKNIESIWKARGIKSYTEYNLNKETGEYEKGKVVIF